MLWRRVGRSFFAMLCLYGLTVGNAFAFAVFAAFYSVTASPAGGSLSLLLQRK
jgi:hypothetical protein